MTKAQEKSKTELLRMGCAMWAKERCRAHGAECMAQRAKGRRRKQLIADSSQLIGRREGKSSS